MRRPALSALAALVAWLALAGSASGGDLDAVRAWREAHGASILAGFRALLAIPNNAGDRDGIARNVAFLQEAFARRGIRLDDVSVDGAPPVLVGRRDVPGATRTLGLYLHYDGQPADSTRWTFAPWTPTLVDGPLEGGGRAIPFPSPGETIDPEWRIVARSAGDDKAPAAAILGALDALFAAGRTPTSNLVFLFEGEEEAGSTHLGEAMERLRARLTADVWLLFDGPVHQSGRPQLVFGVRGFTGMEITVYGPARPLHSGHYGNWAPVPGDLLVSLLASMKDDDGRVLIDGFYDTVAPLGEAERRALDALPSYDDELRDELGLAWTEGGNAPLSERLLLPSLTIQGLSSGNTGALARNVIPATATASIGMRLVEGNDPDAMLDLVEAHIARQGFTIVRDEPTLEFRRAHRRIVRVVRGGGYPAARTSIDDPFARQVTAAATEAAEAPLLVPGLGGSLPLYLFTRTLGAPAVIVPMANHDDLQHAPDENLRIANLWYGIDLVGAILTMPASR